jgi:hypothetical protein
VGGNNKNDKMIRGKYFHRYGMIEKLRVAVEKQSMEGKLK